MIPLTTRILIIDDMPTIISLLKEILSNLGYSNFKTAENGEKALSVLHDCQIKNQPIEFIFSDWQMPKLSGIELLKQIRKEPQWKDLPFLLITSEGEKHQVTEAILSGVSNYVVKPFNAATIKTKMLAAWEKHHKI